MIATSSKNGSARQCIRRAVARAARRHRRAHHLHTATPEGIQKRTATKLQAWGLTMNLATTRVISMCPKAYPALTPPVRFSSFSPSAPTPFR